MDQEQLNHLDWVYFQSEEYSCLSGTAVIDIYVGCLPISGDVKAPAAARWQE